MAPDFTSSIIRGFISSITRRSVLPMNTETWEPVALIPATLSDETATAIEVAETRGGVYIMPMELHGDGGARDCCLTMDEARKLALAILAVTDPEPTSKDDETDLHAPSHLPAYSAATLPTSVRLQAVA